MGYNKIHSKLVLGSAQWGGLSYGINNSSEKITSYDEIKNILLKSRKNGINFIDTSPGYGDAEKNLGLLNIENFKIITKTTILNSSQINNFTIQKFEKNFKMSLKNMKLKKVYGLLVHRSEDLLKKGGNLLVQKLNELKTNGYVDKIGVSVYGVSILEEIFKLFNPDIVQIPINIFDQKAYLDGFLDILKQKNIEIHARSIFLQGLLLMNYKKIPIYFKPWYEHFEKFERICTRYNISQIEASLNFISNIDAIDKFVLGFDNSNQLEECLKFINNKKVIDFSDLIIRDENLINPQNWKK